MTNVNCLYLCHIAVCIIQLVNNNYHYIVSFYIQTYLYPDKNLVFVDPHMQLFSPGHTMIVAYLCVVIPVINSHFFQNNFET